MERIDKIILGVAVTSLVICLGLLVAIPRITMRNMLHSSVEISTLDIFTKQGGRGSGTVIAKKGQMIYILTCAHVVNTSASFQTLYSDPNRTLITVSYATKKGYKLYNAFVVGYDGSKDLALIRVEVDRNDNWLHAVYLSTFKPSTGDTAYSLGNPMGLVRILSKGIISSTEYSGRTCFDGLIAPGNSGGGLFNEAGELIGVSSSAMGYSVLGKIITISGTGMAVDLSTIKKFLKGLI